MSSDLGLSKTDYHSNKPLPRSITNIHNFERSAHINFSQGLKGKLLIMTGSGETMDCVKVTAQSCMLECTV